MSERQSSPTRPTRIAVVGHETLEAFRAAQDANRTTRTVLDLLTAAIGRYETAAQESVERIEICPFCCNVHIPYSYKCALTGEQKYPWGAYHEDCWRQTPEGIDSERRAEHEEQEREARLLRDAAEEKQHLWEYFGHLRDDDGLEFDEALKRLGISPNSKMAEAFRLSELDDYEGFAH